MGKHYQKVGLAATTGFVALAVAVAPYSLVSAASQTSTTTINGTIDSTITISSGPTVSMSVAPSGSAVTSSASDTVSVSTNNASGYTLGLAMNTGTRTLAKGADTIAAASGTLASPAALGTNTWGYRVDNAGGFGAGPTTAETNVASSARTWAGVPAQGSPDTIKTTSSTASGDTTTVWYAMNADSTKPNGVYTNSVVYTATTRP